MHIVLNGEQRELADGLTVDALLSELGFNPQGTVVERNANILDRNAFATTRLTEGDALEVVRLVGGG